MNQGMTQIIDTRVTDWESVEILASGVRGCEACSLAGRFGPCVPGNIASRPEHVRVMVVGEACGETEMTEGIPFAGKAGRKLNEMIRGAGLARANVYVTNVVKQRPSANNDTPKPEHIKVCGPMWLEEEIRSVRPDVVVPMGATAVKYFLPDVTSMSQAHRIPRTVVMEGVGPVTVFPIYHPAAALHNPGLVKALQEDFKGLGELLEGRLVNKEPGPPDSEGYFETTDTVWLAEYLREAGVFSLDTETDEDGFWGLSVSTREGEGIVVRRGSDLEPLKSLMLDEDLLIVGHNWQYDLQVLWRMGFEIRAKLADTMVAAYLIGADGQGLKDLAYRRLGVVMTRYEELIGVQYGKERALRYLEEAGNRVYERLPAEEKVEKEELEKSWKVVKVENGRWGVCNEHGDMVGDAFRTGKKGYRVEVGGVEVGTAESTSGVKRLLMQYLGVYNRDVYVRKTHTPQPIEKSLVRLVGDVSERGANPFERWAGWDKDMRDAIERVMGRRFPRPGISDVPDVQVAIRYSAADADMTLSLFHDLLPEMEKWGVDWLFWNVEMPLVPILAQMTRTGITVDVPYLLDLQAELKGRAMELQDVIEGIIGPFNPNSNDMIAWWLWKCGFELLKMTNSGKPQVNDDVLDEAIKEHIPAIKEIKDFKALTKLRSTYIDAYLEIRDEQCRIHTTFKQTRVLSGRLSSADPNLQNVSKKGEGRRIRAAFVPFVDESGESWVLLSCDMSQIEMRIMAVDAQCRSMLEAFRDGKDIHGATMWDMWKIKKGDVSPEVWEDKRTLAKSLGFGIIFGITGDGLSRQNPPVYDEYGNQVGGLTPGQGDMYIGQWLDARPEVRTQMQKRREEVLMNGYVRDMFGRVAWVPVVYSDNRWEREEGIRTSINVPVQGAAASLLKLAMIAIHKRMREKAALSRMLLQVHDELIFEVPVRELDWMLQMVTYEMGHAWDVGIPTPAEAKMGMRWGELEDVKVKA